MLKIFVKNKAKDNNEIIREKIDLFNPELFNSYPDTRNKKHISINLRNLKKQIIDATDRKAYNFICHHIDISDLQNTILSTSTQFNIDTLADNFYFSIINLKRINDIRYLNKFFESINAKLPINGIFIGCMETQQQRKMRILNKFPLGIGYPYYVFDYILKRVFPKFPITKQIYFLLTRGHNRVLSWAETLGRIYSCGFEIIKGEPIGNLEYFAVRKISVPAYDKSPTYGPLISLKRIGKDGKIINVYKVRTMFPYAEYIQEYIYSTNKLREGGKFYRDFRVSTAGRIMRRLWIDELPMVWNLLKGDLKIVGVRPLSKHYLSLYTSEHRNFRIRFKPGLIPPFYADNPKTIDEIIESEHKYLIAYQKHPFLTDVKYFFKALYNIIIKRKRSN